MQLKNYLFAVKQQTPIHWNQNEQLLQHYKALISVTWKFLYV